MAETPSSNKDNDLNIFKELSWDLDFWKNNETEVVPTKDKLYYMRKIAKYTSFAMILVVIIAIIFWSYVYIQKNENIINNSMLDPVCPIILWDIKKLPWNDSCSSVYSLYNEYNTTTQKLEQNLASWISKIFIPLYKIVSFKNTKEIVFLQTTYPLLKNNIIDIQKDFELLKKNFWIETTNQVICNNISIDNKNNVDITCNFYSYDISNNIKWSDMNTLIKWDSAVLRASFINFIQKNPNTNFLIIEKPKEYSVETTLDNPPYTKVTTLKLKLKYSKIENNL